VDAEGRVVELELEMSNLAGALPREIQQLSALAGLWLGGNTLTGANPAELGQLGALKVLSLHSNYLSEVIPAELARLLSALTCLYLSDNQLSGQEAFRSQMEEHNPKCELFLMTEDFE
jgi:Leucine-rich repeat (LRR) protein